MPPAVVRVLTLLLNINSYIRRPAGEIKFVSRLLFSPLFELFSQKGEAAFFWGGVIVSMEKSRVEYACKG